MKIAVLERFVEPSRRYEPDLVEDLKDDLDVWDLSGGWRGWRSFASKSAPLLRSRLSICDRIRLLSACLHTGGAQAGSIPYAAELLERVRAQHIDRIACFSTKDFALANLLARETGAPCLELLGQGTKYFGEFAFELLAVVPYAHWLHKQGRLRRTIGVSDTRCLYFFSKNHEERAVERHYVPITEYPIGERGRRFCYDMSAFPKALDTQKWSPPNYSKAFRDGRFQWDKEVCVVSNKFSDEIFVDEGRGAVKCGPTNSIEVDVLIQLIRKLRQRYQVVYNRPHASDISTDHQHIHEIGDIRAVKNAFPDTVIIQELHAQHSTLTFNELQLRLYSGCRCFISTLGGNSYLASYFGGTNIVFARRGWEVDCRAFERWFDCFSNARVIAVSSARELLQTVEKELLTSK